MKKNDNAVGTYIFAASTMIFLAFMFLYSHYIYFSGEISVLADLISISYLAFTILYSLFMDKKGMLKYYVAIFTIMIVLIAFSSFYMTLIPTIVNSVVSEVLDIGIAFSILFPTLVIIMLGFYFIRSNVLKAYSKQVGAILLIIAIIVFFYYEIYGFSYKGVTIDDESAISYYAYKAIESGHNPYAITIRSVLENNSTTYGFTPTTNNHIIDYLDYPAIFVMIMAPFYNIYSGSAGSVLSSGNSLAYLVFLIISLFAFASLINKKTVGNFKILIPTMLVFIMYFVQILSVQYMLMIITLMLVFYSIDKWYAFAFIGIAISMQELLWIPSLLVLVYIASTKGITKGIKNAFGAVLVFILINAYFIIQSPMLFVKDVFAPVNGMLLPLPISIGPSLIAMFYPISMHGFEYIFYISILISVIAVYFARNKLLVASMSLFSYFMLYHTLVAYFAIAATLLFMIIIIDDPVQNIKIPKFNIKTRAKNKSSDLHKRNAFIAVFASIFLLFLIIVFSHASYVKNFGVGVSYNGIAKNGTYAMLTIVDNGIYPQNVSILGFYSTNSIVENIEGLSVSNPKYITNISSCNQLCMKNNYLNYNILHLEPKKSYQILLLIPNNTVSLRCVIYTEEYYYECNPILFQ